RALHGTPSPRSAVDHGSAQDSMEPAVSRGWRSSTAERPAIVSPQLGARPAPPSEAEHASAKQACAGGLGDRVRIAIADDAPRRGAARSIWNADRRECVRRETQRIDVVHDDEARTLAGVEVRSS